MVLNEYVNHPTSALIQIIEASSLVEAQKKASLLYPNRGPLEVKQVQKDELIKE